MFAQTFEASSMAKSHGMSASTKVVTAVGACAVAAAAGYYLWTSKQLASAGVSGGVSRRDKKVSLDILKEVTSDLLVELHSVLMEMAQMTQRVRTALAQKGLTSQMTDEQLTEMILQQGIQEKLELTQQRVLKKFGVEAAAIEAAQKLYHSEEAIQRFEAGMDEMFDQAIQGKMPMIPGFEMPADLTADVAIKVLIDVNSEKLVRFRLALKDFYSKHPHPQEADQAELGVALQEANDSSELAVVSRYGDTVPNRAVFHSAVAKYMSNDKHFTKERSRIERTHQMEIVKLLKAGPDGIDANEVMKPIELVDGISDRLEGTNEEGLTIRLLQASEEKSGVVVVITKSMDTAAALMQPISAAIDQGVFDLRKDLQFVYMAAASDSPLIQSERCKDCDIVYVLFPRPDLQQRPVACLSLEELTEAVNDERMFADKGMGLLKFASQAMEGRGENAMPALD